MWNMYSLAVFIQKTLYNSDSLLQSEDTNLCIACSGMQNLTSYHKIMLATNSNQRDNYIRYLSRATLTWGRLNPISIRLRTIEGVKGLFSSATTSALDGTADKASADSTDG